MKWGQQAAAPTVWGFVLAPATPIAAPVGTRVIIRKVRQARTGLPTPNGIHVIDSDPVAGPGTGTTYYLTGTEKLDLSSLSKLGEVVLQKFQYFETTRIVYSAGTHRRGGPFRRRRGKRSIKKFAV